MSASDTLIIHSRYGGLGDHLFMSHLPRVAKSCGVRRVLVSNQAPFRDPAYRELIWERNPYVDGFTDDPGPEWKNVPPQANMNNIDRIMVAHGLDDGKRLHEPEVFYEPKKKTALSRASLYDPNYASFIGFIEGRHVRQWFIRNGLWPDYQMAKRDVSLALKGVKATLRSESIFDFCDIVASVESLYCLGSGTATLAAALGKPATVFFGNGYDRGFCHSPRHSFVYLHNRFALPAIVRFYGRRIRGKMKRMLQERTLKDAGWK